MKKITIAICSVIIVSTVIFTACTKDVKSSTGTVSPAIQSKREIPKGFYYRIVIDDQGRCSCVPGGGNCKSTSSVSDEQSKEISVLQGIIQNSGNGNAYFNTPNWQVLFAEVTDVPGLLSSIQGNQVFLYQLTNSQGTTYGYSYVLSTAPNAASVSDNNTEYAWEY